MGVWSRPWHALPHFRAVQQGDSCSLLDHALWFAVPKQKVSRMKKRRKATLRDRIKKREDIITDPRTGEKTLRHRLPENWKDYLPDANLNPQ